MRKWTNSLIGYAENRILSWEEIARAALQYMSEDEVEDMARCNEFIIDDEDENDDEDDIDADEKKYICTLDGCEVRRFDTYDEAEAWCNMYDGDKDADFYIED